MAMQQALKSEQALDVARLRADFPVLQQHVDGKPLMYLDNASTTQKPRAMIDRLYTFYARENAKTKASHTLGRQVTDEYEGARARVAAFINAAEPSEIVFVRGATEALNVVAAGFARDLLQPGDEIVLTTMEHHANIVPWLMACRQSGARVKVAPLTADGEVDLDQFAALLTPRTRVVGVSHVSNVLGVISPLKRMVEMAAARDIPVVVDGAQGAPHLPVDVQEMGCAFYAFSAHKVYGPTGLGVLYGRREWLDKLPPQEGGSTMAERVSFEDMSYSCRGIPQKFEAGVPAIAETIAFAASLDYVGQVGMDRISAYEKDLVAYAAARLSAIDGVTIAGSSPDKVSVLSFTVEGIKPQDVADYLDRQAGIATRSGALSAQPLMTYLGLPGVVRASFALYNTPGEVDALAEGIKQCITALT